MSDLQIRVLGPVEVLRDGVLLRVSKPRHREILCLLVIARGRAVSTARLIDELWDDAPAAATGIVQTFIGELRKILEPLRPARTPPTVLVTTAAGYALDLPVGAVDLWQVEHLTRTATEYALALWRGSAFEEFADREWATGERARSAELRAGAVERWASRLLELGRPGEVVALLDAHVETHRWREEGWRLLALALVRTGRRADALSLLRSARTTFVDGLGLDPSTVLLDLEQRILDDDRSVSGDRDSILMQTAVHAGSGTRSQLESATALLPLLALSGSVDAATERRVATIAAAEEFGDPELTARVIVGYDVPGSWTRSDDPDLSRSIVDAADRTLRRLPPTASRRVRARLLATIAMESRGVDSRIAEAVEAEAIARSLGDPALLCYTLSARYLQTVETTGLAAERLRIGDEIVTVASVSELSTFEIEGRLIRMQALCASGDIGAASVEADLVDAVADRFERPLASVFTAWFRRTFLGGPTPSDGTEMPGFRVGLRGMVELTDAVRAGSVLPDADVGPYAPWVAPLLATGAEASDMLEVVPDPPHDLMSEVCWYLVGRAAIAAGHRDSARRALTALQPAASERAAGSGAVDLGPIAPLLDDLTEMIRREDRRDRR